MTIRIKYIIALCLVAVMVSISAFVMQSIFKTQEQDGEIINISGQQRMLSQRIALLEEHIILGDEDYDKVKGLLREAVNRFQNNHEYLTELDNLPESVKEIYYGQDKLHDRVIQYVDASRLFLVQTSGVEHKKYLSVDFTDPLLRDLNRVVKEFEKAANERVKNVERIELLIWMITLIILVLEGIFIFYPMEKSITEKIKHLQIEREKAEKAQAAATKASQAKSEFLASMSHELRTPMNGMFGMMELALDNPKQTPTYLQKAKNAGKQLLVLINDLLDFSKIEAGKLTLEHVSFDLAQLIDEVVVVQEVHCRSSGLDFNYKKQTQIPNFIFGDPTRIAQMLHNLMSNAVKFTKEGSVTIQVGMHIKDKKPWLTFNVIDTGIGIPNDKLQHIFDKFSQADQSTTRQFGGTGLGLAITQNLAELMGGEISVTSVEGEGSTFSISIPTEIDASRVKHSEQESNLTCAVVDDLESSCEFLMHLAKSAGYKVESFTSPKEFLAQDKEYNVVLLDLAMPELDGIAVLKELIVKYSEKMPFIIYVSAALDQLPVPDAIQSYVWKTHPKPVQRQALEQDLAYLKTLLNSTEESGSTEADQGANILLVEDNDLNAEIAKAMLESAGHHITLATNGEKAVNACMHHKFDLVLMDMSMPVMDGVTATIEIRQKLKLDVPIIALTANAFAEDREKCEAAGMNGFLSKPIDKFELLEYAEKFSQKA